MSPPKFIFANRFFYPDHSATSQILSDLAFYLAQQGMRVSVLASRGLYDDPEADLPAFENKNGVEIHRVYRPRFGRHSLLGRALDYLAMYGAFAAAVGRLAQRGDRLIVKTDPPLLSVALAPVARVKRLLLINWLQDLYPELALRLGVRALAPAAPVLIAARNASLRAAAVNVVIGASMRQRLEGFGLSADRIAIIPNWCDDELITPSPTTGNPLRSAWGLEGKFVVGYSGNLGRAHEYKTLLEAAERLRAESNIIFLFIGGGHLMQPLKAEVEQRGLGKMFQFRPYQPPEILPQSLAVPDVHWVSLAPAMEGLIVPSKFYGVAAVGRPTIAIGDPKGEIAQLVTHHNCGVAIDSGNALKLVDTILAMRNDNALVTQMSHNARALLDRSFRKQHALQNWECLLRSFDVD